MGMDRAAFGHASAIRPVLLMAGILGLRGLSDGRKAVRVWSDIPYCARTQRDVAVDSKQLTHFDKRDAGRRTFHAGVGQYQCAQHGDGFGV